ncbi:hypothetical protein THRCLA_22848 [Thraustotheca clavata]|uniref:Uncharacterized protein n=1 Tax=Thraustotheca clavata TaxID=74557 RepID=A0A1V9YS31_9STRA|nr:hypothetical protein THRCLA_22848 [Thraustotheca clavata]
MAIIAVPERIFSTSQANASLDTCVGTNGVYVRQHESHGLCLVKYVKCAAQDGLGKKHIPELRFWRHHYTKDGYPSFLMFAIHTVPSSLTEIGWGLCPPPDNPGSLVIPSSLPTTTKYYV